MRKPIKLIDGEELTADCFLLVPNPQDPSGWRLPWKFSTRAKTIDHVTNHLQRLRQLKSVSIEDRAELASKLVKIREGQYSLPAIKRVTRPVTTDSRAQSLQIERRTAGTVDLSAGTNSGTAVTYNHLSSDLGGWRERIQRGAFTSTLKSKADIACLYSHDTGKPLGRTGSGTLQVWEDAAALRWKCKLPDTSAGRDLMTSVQRGDLVQCSFGFICRKSSWNDEPDPENSRQQISVRIVTDAELLEVSPVLWGAYGDGTSVSAERSMFPSGVPAEIRARLKQSAVVQVSEEADRKRLLARLHTTKLIDSL